MRPPPDRQCHILRLPYELLKPIIADLSQRDQLSIAKTCVHLWELAYPMLYDRIVVDVDPVTADIVWSNLASGVGLRHVRHLEVRSSGQSSTNAEKQIRAADSVAGLLLGALRRHQLLSFGLTHPGCAAFTMSTRNIAVLLETQQQLTELNLPGVKGSSDISITDYLPVSLRTRNLRNITFQLSSDKDFDDVSSSIMQNSPSLDSIHLRVLAHVEVPARPVFALPTRGSFRSVLFSLATNLTILGYDFENISDLHIMPSFPALQALSVIDCQNDVRFYTRARPGLFPKLQALMVKSTGVLSDDLHGLIGGLSSLRELVVDGKYVFFPDNSCLHSHAQTLELRSLNQRECVSVFLTRKQTLSGLDAMTSLRHLSVCIGNFNYYEWDRLGFSSDRNLTELSAGLSSHHTLRTLTLRCTSNVHTTKRTYGDEMTRVLSDSTYLEKLIGDATWSRLRQGGSMLDDTTLEYLAVIVEGGAYTCGVPIETIKAMTQAPRRAKTLLSLHSKPSLQPAALVKEEMMARYAKDNYYFLESYVNRMAEASRVKIFGPFGGESFTVSDEDLSDEG